jgi:hypothetical protein
VRAAWLSVSIEDNFQVVASSVLERIALMAPKAIDRVKRNRRALLGSWNEGDSWLDERASTFTAGLKNLPKR